MKQAEAFLKTLPRDKMTHSLLCLRIADFKQLNFAKKTGEKFCPSIVPSSFAERSPPMSLLSTMVNHIACLPDAPQSPALPEGQPDIFSLFPPADTPAPQSPADAPQPALYVSTELDLRRADDARQWPRDALIEGQVYRRLDPEYFAWLHSRMTAAQSAHRSGRLSRVTWDTPSGRF